MTDPGGHSSLPRPENAIYRLAAGLTRLAPRRAERGDARVFRAHVAPRARTARRGHGGRGCHASGRGGGHAAVGVGVLQRADADDLRGHPLDAGHAENALPQMASAVINCRMLPGETAANVQATLARVLDDARISIAPVAQARPSPPSPLTTEVLDTIERVTEAMWPGVPVVPTMGTGATDGLYLRIAGIPTYGVSGLFEDIDDTRSHGRDERMGVKEYYEGLDFLYRLVKTLSAGSPGTNQRQRMP